MNREGRKTASTERRHVIYFQAKTSLPDGQGGFVDTWTDIAPAIWAAVIPVRADKVAEFRSHNVHVTHYVKVSGYTDVSELNRIRFGSRIFNILTCENVQERDFEKWITCEEVRA